MLSDYPTIVDHIINKTKEVYLFIETSDSIDKSVFIDKGIDEDNGIFIDVDLFVQVDGEAKQKISDTHGQEKKYILF